MRFKKERHDLFLCLSPHTGEAIIFGWRGDNFYETRVMIKPLVIKGKRDEVRQKVNEALWKVSQVVGVMPNEFQEVNKIIYDYQNKSAESRQKKKII